MINELEVGAEQLGIKLTVQQCQQLNDYLILLGKWNKTYNLTAIRDSAFMVPYHVLDSLSVVPYLEDSRNLLDVGSGGGMPGVPIAVICPDTVVTLIDANQKKTAFLRQVALELNLANIRVKTVRVEHFRKDTLFDTIISRAFSEIDTFVRLTVHLLGKGGKWLAMKGAFPEQELEQLDADRFNVNCVYPLRVPGLDGQRHLVKISQI